MSKTISYIALSHPGKLRKNNQDNFICISRHMGCINNGTPSPISGRSCLSENPLFGVFDGMGGEEKGETAAFLAASEAAKTTLGFMPVPALYDYCRKVNKLICDECDKLGLRSMGTTAAMAVFQKKGVCICSIGDSRIYRFREGLLTQLTKDHILPCRYGKKPPLLQYLGIPEHEMTLEPFLHWDEHRKDDIYLICTDGLTDMLSDQQICSILTLHPFEISARKLLDWALSNGGRDNVTIVLCKMEDKA